MSKAKLPDDERFALTLKAWLAWKSGKGISGLAFRSSGEGAEAFPKIPVVLPDVG